MENKLDKRISNYIKMGMIVGFDGIEDSIISTSFLSEKR